MRRRRLLATLATAVTGSNSATGRRRPSLSNSTASDWSRLQAGGFGGQSQIDPDRTRIEITLQDSATAGWRLALWTRLDTDDAESAFRSLETDIESDPSTVLDTFESRMNETVTAAAEATGREMTASSFSVTTETRAIPQQYGLLVYQFVWDGFARVEDETLWAGDAIDGLLLETGTRLSIRWPDRYERRSIEPAPDESDDHVVAWSGAETDFLSGQPRIAVTTDSTARTEKGGSDTWPLIGGGVLGTLGVAGVLWWARQHGRDFSLFGESGTSPSGSDQSTDSAAIESDDSDHAAGASTDSSDPPPELLSNEERVLQLLEDHGGRIKQQQVVAELEWTEAKTSQVVTALREEGQIEVFRIGRENVLAMPDTDEL